MLLPVLTCVVRAWWIFISEERERNSLIKLDKRCRGGMKEISGFVHHGVCMAH